MMELKEIEKYCEKAFNKAGYDFSKSSISLSINGRLTRTLGRCRSKCIGGVWTPYAIEFSRQFLETSTDNSIIDVIYHECAHALVGLETGEMHGHDHTFKTMCKRIGTTNDKTQTAVERTVSEESLYKYTIVCPECGKIGGYTRMCKTLKEIKHYSCKKCGSQNLSYVQNW